MELETDKHRIEKIENVIAQRKEERYKKFPERKRAPGRTLNHQ